MPLATFGGNLVGHPEKTSKTEETMFCVGRLLIFVGSRAFLAEFEIGHWFLFGAWEMYLRTFFASFYSCAIAATLT